MREFAWSQLDYYSLLPFGGVECRWNGGGFYPYQRGCDGAFGSSKLHFNPTAENIAHWICEQIPFCFKVEVRESEGNTVIYEKD